MVTKKIKNATFYLSMGLIILTHVGALFLELSESMWMGHNILMIVLGGLAIATRK